MWPLPIWGLGGRKVVSKYSNLTLLLCPDLQKGRQRIGEPIGSAHKWWPPKKQVGERWGVNLRGPMDKIPRGISGKLSQNAIGSNAGLQSCRRCYSNTVTKTLLCWIGMGCVWKGMYGLIQHWQHLRDVGSMVMIRTVGIDWLLSAIKVLGAWHERHIWRDSLLLKMEGRRCWKPGLRPNWISWTDELNHQKGWVSHPGNLLSLSSSQGSSGSQRLQWGPPLDELEVPSPKRLFLLPRRGQPPGARRPGRGLVRGGCFTHHSQLLIYSTWIIRVKTQGDPAGEGHSLWWEEWDFPLKEPQDLTKADRDQGNVLGNGSWECQMGWRRGWQNISLYIPGGSVVKSAPAMQETWVRSLGQEDPLEKGMTAHSSAPAGGIPWTEESGGLKSMGSQRFGHNRATNTFSLQEELLGHSPMTQD